MGYLPFSGFFFFVVDCLGGWNQWMRLVSCRRQAGVGGVVWGGVTRSQVKVEYFIIPYTSTSTRLPDLCQGYHDDFVVTANDGGMKMLGGGSFMLGLWLGEKGWVSYFFYFFLFFFLLLLNVLSRVVHDSCCVRIFVLCFPFFVPGPFN